MSCLLLFAPMIKEQCILHAFTLYRKNLNSQLYLHNGVDLKVNRSEFPCFSSGPTPLIFLDAHSSGCNALKWERPEASHRVMP